VGSSQRGHDVIGSLATMKPHLCGGQRARAPFFSCSFVCVPFAARKPPTASPPRPSAVNERECPAPAPQLVMWPSASWGFGGRGACVPAPAPDCVLGRGIPARGVLRWRRPAAPFVSFDTAQCTRRRFWLPMRKVDGSADPPLARPTVRGRRPSYRPRPPPVGVDAVESRSPCCRGFGGRAAPASRLGVPLVGNTGWCPASLPTANRP